MKDTTVKKYIMAIYELGGERELVKTSEIAAALGHSPPSVTEIFQSLSQEGIVAYVPHMGAILTGKGKNIAEKVMERRTILEKMLLYVGVPQELAEVECRKIEPVLNDRAIEWIHIFLRN